MHVWSLFYFNSNKMESNWPIWIPWQFLDGQVESTLDNSTMELLSFNHVKKHKQSFWTYSFTVFCICMVPTAQTLSVRFDVDFPLFIPSPIPPFPHKTPFNLQFLVIILSSLFLFFFLFSFIYIIIELLTALVLQLAILMQSTDCWSNFC